MGGRPPQEDTAQGEFRDPKVASSIALGKIPAKNFLSG